MDTVNYTVVRRNGMTITGQASSVDEALAELGRMSADPFYNPGSHDRRMQAWELVFIGSENGPLREYSLMLGIGRVGGDL